MPKYRVHLCGANCLVKDDSGVQRLGFFTMRTVVAEGDELAESAGVSAVMAELAGSLTNSEADPPSINVERLERLQVGEVPTGPEATGLVFFPDDDE